MCVSQSMETIKKKTHLNTFAAKDEVDGFAVFSPSAKDEVDEFFFCFVFMINCTITQHVKKNCVYVIKNRSEITY